MAVFAVHLSGDSYPTAADRLEKAYEKDHFLLSERLYLVKADSLARDVVQTVGIGDNDDPAKVVTGAVFKLNAAYSGFDSRAMWEWLAEAERSSAVA